MTNWFSHSGDIGDIIYGLPAIRAVGGGRLILFNFPGDPGRRTAHGMTEAKVDRMRPLLELQPYIESVEWSAFGGPDHNLNGFRDHLRHCGNLADAHLRTHGFNWLGRVDRWLDVPDCKTVVDVVFARSPRYHNGKFPWLEAVARYGDRAGFVGFPEEHEEFCRSYGHVEMIEAPDLLALAKVIAGSKLFVGNQSAPLAVAHGMKHPVVMEVQPGPSQHHCIFQRMNCIIGWDEKIEWPKI